MTTFSENDPFAKSVDRFMTPNTKSNEEKLVEHLVNRFLGWHLPRDFRPDGGIMFMDVYDNGTEQGGKFEPVGTNLFTAEQAKEMFRFLLENDDGSSFFDTLKDQAHKAEVEEACKMFPWWIERAEDIVEDIETLKEWKTATKESRGDLLGIHSVASDLVKGLKALQTKLTPLPESDKSN